MTTESATRTTPRRSSRLVTAVLAAVMLAACSSDPPTSESSAPSAPQVANTDDPTATAAPNSETTVAIPDLGSPSGWTDQFGTTLLFNDITDDVGVGVSFSSALDVELVKDTAVMMGGAGAADFDNDGDTDLFILGGGNHRDSLFVNDGAGNFTDITEAAGLAEPHLGSGVAVGDYNSDGWLDIFVTSHGVPDADASTGSHLLYRNNGDLTFTDVALEAGVATTSTITHDGFGAVFGDIDLDGDLDLFVAGWQRDALGTRLFQNDGDGTFTDITDVAGIVDDGIRGFSPCMIDMTGDRFPEIMLVSDFGTSRYWSNSGQPTGADGRFTEMTSQAGVGVEWSGMGTAVGDVNNDGMLDWYATAIYDADDVGRGLGNALYLNQGDNSFLEVAAQAGVDDGGWGWGALMVDVNHDGWLDIIETNGWDLPSYVGNLSRMWIADGTGSFTEVAAQAGPLHNLHGLGVLSLDLEGDGDQDIAITASNDDFTLYRNDMSPSSAGWLRIFLDTSGNPSLAPNGVGSMVRVDVGDLQLTRTIGGCSNYNTSSELSAHFGLGDVAAIEQVTVEWPNGEVTVLEDVQPNQTLTITAPG